MTLFSLLSFTRNPLHPHSSATHHQRFERELISSDRSKEKEKMIKQIDIIKTHYLGELQYIQNKYVVKVDRLNSTIVVSQHHPTKSYIYVNTIYSINSIFHLHLVVIRW